MARSIKTRITPKKRPDITEKKGKSRDKQGSPSSSRDRRFKDDGRKSDGRKPRVLERHNVVGVVAKTPYGYTLLSTDRRERNDYSVRETPDIEKMIGDLVVAEIQSGGNFNRHDVVIKENLGDPEAAKNVSLIAIHTHDLPHQFSKAAFDEAEAAKPVPLGDRTDLRAIPLVTIDGADARDFDDAVFAEHDPKTGGWHLIVAIADVSHYVKAGGVLDNEAYERGNSVYFPDRVVPMLPEALSNELCSLKPKVERACMAVHLYLNKDGELSHWQFVRGLMKSVARLTYDQVQAAHDGKPDKATKPLLETVIKPLYQAYDLLAQARKKRGTLELDLPERKVELGEDGFIKAVKLRERFDSHRLIEEFMILANVAAASQLEGKGGICIYRVHDKPNDVKLTSLREFLDGIGISLVPAKQLHPRMLTQVLEKAADTPNASVVNEVVLRSQAQAIYSKDNIGHFGLALAKYAHFTSPIRRYADLVVHRGLIKACKLGKDGLSDEGVRRLTETAEHISMTERRASTAEREVVDRFTTMFLADQVGAEFMAHISGVAKFGLFARIDDMGAEGIVPFSSMPHDFYDYDEKRQALVGKRTNRVYQLSQAVKVKIETVDKLTGSMSFKLVEEDVVSRKSKKQSKPNKPGKENKTAGGRHLSRSEKYKMRQLEQ